LAAEVAVPEGVVTVIAPVVAAPGTVAVIWVAPLTTNVALVPLKATFVVFWNAVPVIVTDVPGGPLAGLNLVIVGGFTADAVLPGTGAPRSATTHTRPNRPRVALGDNLDFADAM
jgi:hypothetical protein